MSSGSSIPSAKRRMGEAEAATAALDEILARELASTDTAAAFNAWRAERDAANPQEFGYSTIASGTVRTDLFASGLFCEAEASVLAISASAITDANSAIE